MNETLNEWFDITLAWLEAHGLAILLILIGGYIFQKVLRRFIIRLVRISVRPGMHESEEAERKREDTLIRIFSWATSIMILAVMVMMVLQQVGVAIGPILAGAGIVGIAVGFGGQYIIRDLFTGFFLIMENQYRIGDVVRLDDTSGTVEDISLRMTTLRDLDGTVHHVPHGDIKRVSNLSKQFARINMNIGVAYDTDLDKAIEVINQTGKELADDPEWKSFMLSPPQFLRVDEFGDSAITIKVLGDVIPHQQWAVGGEFRKRLKKAFDKAGIEIPFPQRVIHHLHHEKDDIDRDAGDDAAD